MRMQLALDLVQAQHCASECQASLDTHKARLSEAKAAQLARVAARLDARLQAALSALDVTTREVDDWSKGGASLLRQYAALLTGKQAIPGALQYCASTHTQCQTQRCLDTTLCDALVCF